MERLLILEFMGELIPFRSPLHGINAQNDYVTPTNYETYSLTQLYSNIWDNYSAVTNVRNPSTTPAKFGIMRMQSFFGSLVQPYITQMRHEIEAVSGCHGWALLPLRLARICGMQVIKTKTPIKAPTDPTIVLIFCLFIIYFPFKVYGWYFNTNSGYFYKKTQHSLCFSD